MFSSTFQRVSASSDLPQDVLMPFQFVVGLGLDGYILFQQIEDHFADGVDLIGIGVRQHVTASVPIGFLQDTL